MSKDYSYYSGACFGRQLSLSPRHSTWNVLSQP